MRIAFCTPFKPLDHPRPSGDVMIARSIHDFLARRGHTMLSPPHFETTWFFWRPRRWPALLRAILNTRTFLRNERPDLWFTYHSYDKAPDVLGPWLGAKRAAYALYSGAYAPVRGRKLRFRPGFYLNRKVLHDAGHIFIKEIWDLKDVNSLVGPEKTSYVPPCLVTEDFVHDAAARQSLRQEWQVGDHPVVLSVAVFRPGVKTEGLSQVIKACGRLVRQGGPFADLELVIGGDGPGRRDLQELARKEMPKPVRFLGMVDRKELPKFYSAADIFAFPGINEAVGMVYLEAQSCGLPVVAWDHFGGKICVSHGYSGLVTPSFDEEAFAAAIGKLVTDKDFRKQLAEQAQLHVREKHDLEKNFSAMEAILENLVQDARRSGKLPEVHV